MVYLQKGTKTYKLRVVAPDGRSAILSTECKVDARADAVGNKGAIMLVVDVSDAVLRQSERVDPTFECVVFHARDHVEHSDVDPFDHRCENASRCFAVLLGVDAFSEQDSRRIRFPRFEQENLERNLEIVDRLEEMAREKEVQAGQLALAWVMHQGDDIVPIPGTKRVHYLEENAAAAGVELSDDDLRRLDEIAPPGVAAGDRYADMSVVDR